MDFFKSIGVYFFTFSFLSRFVYSPDGINKAYEARLQLMMTRRQCRREIIESFENQENQLDQAKYAFDYFEIDGNEFKIHGVTKYKINGVSNLNVDTYLYYKEFEFKILPVDSVQDPALFCQSQEFINEYRENKCVEILHNTFGDFPELIIKSLFYNSWRTKFLYHELHGMQVFDEDVVSYWDHLKEQFYLRNFPSMLTFCRQRHPGSFKYIVNQHD